MEAKSDDQSISIEENKENEKLSESNECPSMSDDNLENGKPPKSVFGSHHSVNNNSMPTSGTTKSRIPQREKSFQSSKVMGKAPPIEKKFSLRKKSKTSLDIKSIAESESTNQPHQTCKKPLCGMSSSPSTMTLPSMNSHRLGAIPAYLKRPEKLSLELNLRNKKKAFNNERKKLVAQQKELFATYQTLHDLQRKYNKSSGNDEQIEELKWISFNYDNEGHLLINNTDCDGSNDQAGRITTTATETSVNSTSKGMNRQLPPNKTESKKIPDAAKLKEFESKMVNIHQTGFKLCQEFVDSFDEFTKDKEGNQEAGDTRALEKEILRILKTMEEKTVKEEKQQVTRLDQLSFELRSLFSEASDAPNFDSQNELLNQIEDQNKKLQQSSQKLKDLEKKITLGENIVTALRSQIKEKETILLDKEKEVTKANDLSKRLAKNLECKSKDIVAKDTLIRKLETEIETLKTRLKQLEPLSEDIKRQKDNVSRSIKSEQEARKLLEVEKNKRISLENELSEKNKLLEKLQNESEAKLLASGDQSNEEMKLKNEINSLKNKIQQLITEKDALHKEKANLQEVIHSKENCLNSELAKVKTQNSQLSDVNSNLQEKISNLENILAEEISAMDELQQKASNSQYLTSTTKDLQNEISRLRNADTEKRREIETLRSELCKAQIEIKQQEETICMHQRILRIRCELINSLQDKETANRTRMDDLYSEINKKATLVNQLNNEMTAKAEELQNLFSTLGSKQLEVTKQEKIIKLLEENHERNQRLRVKQEERIARVENENTELKQLLSCFENSNKNSLHRKSEIYRAYKDGENLLTQNISDSERCKRRHKEIDVKKIFK